MLAECLPYYCQYLQKCTKSNTHNSTALNPSVTDRHKVKLSALNGTLSFVVFKRRHLTQS